MFWNPAGGQGRVFAYSEGSNGSKPRVFACSEGSNGSKPRVFPYSEGSNGSNPRAGRVLTPKKRWFLAPRWVQMRFRPTASGPNRYVHRNSGVEKRTRGPF